MQAYLCIFNKRLKKSHLIIKKSQENNPPLLYNGFRGDAMGIIKTKLTHFVTKEKEGIYYTVPFDVPCGIRKLTVSYSYFRKTKGILGDLHPTNTIDIGLVDEKGRFLGWSGSAHKSIYVGEFDSSNGYLSEPINEGKWGIIVGAYHVMPEGVEVTYEFEFEEKGEELLFGDLHVHSDASDGEFDMFTLGKKAKKIGLDFLAAANHNNYSENLNLPHLGGFTFIPAVEWTHYNGHMNFFGVKAPFENSFIANNLDEMRKLIQNARDLGAVISVNHPKCRFCPYKWQDDGSFDMMEIWNGPMRKTNTDGIEWWTQLLKEGRKIPAVGGSDFHRNKSFVSLGNPVTAVWSESRKAEDILNGIRAGRCFVSKSIDGPRLRLGYGGARMGETAKYSNETEIEISAEKLGGAKIILVTRDGEQTVFKGGKDEFSGKFNLPKTNFAYIKAVKGRRQTVKAVSNPIYFE